MKSILQLCEDLPIRKLVAEEDLIVENRPIRALYVLKEGSVEILKQKTQINVVSTPGALFGEISVLLNQRPMATVRALEPSSFCEVEDAEAFLEKHPDLNLHIARLLARRLNAVTNYLVDIKAQFESHSDHLGMVDEVLESILHHQKA